MKRAVVFTFLVLLGCMIGCSGSDVQGSEVPKEVTNELKSLSDAAKAASGDFSKLSPENQQKFIARAGTEEAAKRLVQQMAIGPQSRSGG